LAVAEIVRSAAGEKHIATIGSSEGTRNYLSVIPGRCEGIEPGISRFSDVQLHIVVRRWRDAPE
jgi:hypothetical protein